MLAPATILNLNTQGLMIYLAPSHRRVSAEHHTRREAYLHANHPDSCNLLRQYKHLQGTTQDYIHLLGGIAKLLQDKLVSAHFLSDRMTSPYRGR
ncbi:hypothetical protein CGCF413_v001827 [Colletotrichum fructicola]|nr:hypothetical protein CGCF413_v001827 [Colletotrichum fructicola]